MLHSKQTGCVMYTDFFSGLSARVLENGGRCQKICPNYYDSIRQLHINVITVKAAN